MRKFNLSDSQWCSHLKFMISLEYQNANEETFKPGNVVEENKSKLHSNLSSSTKTKKGHWEKQKQSPNPTTLSQGPLARTKNQRACLPRGRLKESEFHGETSVLQQRPTEKIEKIVLINARVIVWSKGLAHFNLNFRNRFSKLLNN